MSRLWPVAEAAQADYETLRAAVLAGTPPLGPAATRFAAAGLWALIRRPVAEPAYTASLLAARRPPWTPYSDPRLDALGDAYELVLSAHDHRVTARAQETGS